MIAEIENAILARLDAACKRGVLPYTFAGLETYPDNWDHWIKERVIKFPAAWVVFSGGDGAQSTGYVAGLGAKVDASFVVVVAGQNLRSEQAQRHGGVRGEIGAYQLIGDVVGLLNGHNCDIAIAPLSFRGVKLVRPNALITERKLSVWAIHFTTNFVMPIIEFEPDAEFDGDLNTAAADWQVDGVTALSQTTEFNPEESL
jgi:phage gp37-like protein